MTENDRVQYRHFMVLFRTTKKGDDIALPFLKMIGLFKQFQF